MRVLPARLIEALSAVGGRGVQQSKPHELQFGSERHSDGRVVLAITGMKAEARIAAGAGVSVIASGGNRGILEAALDNVFEANIDAVLSFGMLAASRRVAGRHGTRRAQDRF